MKCKSVNYVEWLACMRTQDGPDLCFSKMFSRGDGLALIKVENQHTSHYSIDCVRGLQENKNFKTLAYAIYQMHTHFTHTLCSP